MSNLTIPLPICNLDCNGKFIIPNTCDKIWFDIGTSINSPNGVQFLKRNKNGFVLGFEPNPQMYFTIYSTYYFNKNKWLVDKQHPTAEIEVNKRIKNQKRQIFNDTEEFIGKDDFMKRYILIPCAISINDSYMPMYQHIHEGSSSLEKTWHNVDKNNTMLVKSYPLKKFIDMIPDKYEYIEHVKIDCEGHDLKVLESAEDRIHRIAVITVEDNNCTKFFNNNGFELLERQNGGVSYINTKYKELKSELDYFIRV